MLSSKLVCLSSDLLDTFYYLFHSLSPYLKTEAVTLFLCSQSFRDQWRVCLVVVSPLSFQVSTYNGLEVGEKESMDHSKEGHTVRVRADFWLFMEIKSINLSVSSQPLAPFSISKTNWASMTVNLSAFPTSPGFIVVSHFPP